MARAGAIRTVPLDELIPEVRELVLKGVNKKSKAVKASGICRMTVSSCPVGTIGLLVILPSAGMSTVRSAQLPSWSEAADPGLDPAGPGDGFLA